MGSPRQLMTSQCTSCSLVVCYLMIYIAGILIGVHQVSAALPAFATTTHVSTLYEHQSSEVTLANFTCTDADPSDIPTVDMTSLTPTPPCSNCFVVHPAALCDGVGYCLKYIPSGSIVLDASAVTKYEIVVTCNSGTDSVTADVDVYLTPNTAPRFDPVQSVAFHTQTGTKTVTSGIIIYNVTAVDDNNDNIVYSMISSPDTGYFDIGPGDGRIQANRNLASLCMSGISTITFYVNITDNHNAPVGPQAVQVTFQDMNVAPAISNLDVTEQTPEDTAVGGVIKTFLVTDDEAVSKLTYTLSAVPSANLAYYEIDSGEVKVKATLDYETSTARNTNLTIQVTDDDGCTSPVYYYDVTVTDVNEAPILQPSYSVHSVYEGPDFGSPATLAIAWTVTDEDIVDTKTYSIVAPAGQTMFSIDPNTGVLSVISDYDIDTNGAALPTTQTLTVQVTDKGGLTGNATVVLNFKDRNDQPPKITATTTSFTVCNSNVGATLGGTLSCTDQDTEFEGNNDTYTTGSGTGITVGASGELILSAKPTAGVTYFTTAYCHDRGTYPGPLQSLSAITLSVIGTDCTTVTQVVVTAAPTQAATAAATSTAATTTTATSDANETDWVDENLPWIMVAALLATLLLGLLCYMIYNYCYPYCQKYCCQKKPPKPRPRTPPQKITPVEDPVSPPPVIVGTPYLYDFWKEKYTDDDYGKQPNRDANPRPVTPIDSGADASPAQNDSAPPPKNSSCCIIL